MRIYVYIYIYNIIYMGRRVWREMCLAGMKDIIPVL
jgi:hypothetical protein